MRKTTSTIFWIALTVQMIAVGFAMVLWASAETRCADYLTTIADMEIEKLDARRVADESKALSEKYIDLYRRAMICYRDNKNWGE